MWQVTGFPVQYGGLSSVEVVGSKAVAVAFGIAAHFRFLPLAAAWEGTQWSSQPVRHHGVSDDTQLSDVDLPSATSGWAVGTGDDSNGSVAVTARRTASAWVGVPLDVVLGQFGFLGVRALGRNDAWAAGQKQIGFNPFPVIAHFNGQRWH